MNRIKRMTTIFLLLSVAIAARGQCKLESKIGADGTMYYYLDREPFSSGKDSLSGGMVTDKENFFLVVYPNPVPPRKEAMKLNKPLLVTLSNNKQYKLENFNLQFNKTDSSLMMMYLVDKNMLKDFRQFDVSSLKINMGATEGIRNYDVREHGSLIRKHLTCLDANKSKD